MSEEIDRWIEYMKQHPDTWKQKHTQFINAQFSKSKQFYEKISKTPLGKEKIISVFSIKNKEGYPSLFP